MVGIGRRKPPRWKTPLRQARAAAGEKRGGQAGGGWGGEGRGGEVRKGDRGKWGCWKLAYTRHKTKTTRHEQRDANTNLLNIKSLKSWSICCKQQPAALNRQDVQKREL